MYNFCSLSKEYSSRNSETMVDLSHYVSNPVNAYLLIKRLTSDWAFVESIMKSNMADEFINNITNRRQMNQAGILQLHTLSPQQSTQFHLAK